VNLLSSLVQPMLYLLGLGVGVGSLVDRNTGSSDVLGASSYVAFVAPGLLVTTAMALAAGESMWPVMGGLKWSRGYHGMAATPLSARDIVVGHGTWMALRCGIAAGAVAACSPPSPTPAPGAWRPPCWWRCSWARRSRCRSWRSR
jgi:lipooligosaccharide transport system permease protein